MCLRESRQVVVVKIKVIRRGGVGRENRLLGQGRPLKLWGDSKCKGLKAAARLRG